jgi:cystathionine gamma-lyase
MSTREWNFDTLAVHAGTPPDPLTGAVMTPVYLTSTYVQEAPGKHKGYEYSRTANPTRTALQNSLASLEKARFGLAFASGLSATNTVLNLFQKGDHIVCGDDVYGGTYRLFKRVFEQYGLEFSFVDTTNPSALEKAMLPHTRLLWLESPTNPLLKITDLSLAAEIAHRHGALVCVDNTFATPYLQNPLSLGADLVVHSTTKYLGGHSDVVGGAIVTNREDLYERLAFFQNAVGAVPGPLDCFLVLRGIKTLALRMRKHCENARAVAEFLKGHPKVERVYYPGLQEHPGHEIARRQMRDFGGMVSFEVKGGVENSLRVATGTHLFALAESLGGVESLIEVPALMTHASVPPEERERAGLRENLIRLSLGIEDAEDLIADLDSALSKA